MKLCRQYESQTASCSASISVHAPHDALAAATALVTISTAVLLDVGLQMRVDSALSQIELAYNTRYHNQLYSVSRAIVFCILPTLTSNCVLFIYRTNSKSARIPVRSV